MTNLGVYATLEQVKEYLISTKDVNVSSKDDQKLIQMTVAMSRAFDSHCKRKFFPRLETRYYLPPGNSSTAALSRTSGGFVYAGYSGAYSQSNYPNISTNFNDPSTLHVKGDLLSVVELKTANETVTIADDDYD